MEQLWADVRVLQKPKDVEPRRSSRLKEMRNANPEPRTSLGMHPNVCQGHNTDSITQTIVTTEIPHGSTQCSPQQGYRRTHGNAASPPKSIIQQS